MITDHETFLDEIYAAAIDTRAWASVIGRFTEMLGGASGFLSALDMVTGKGPLIGSRINPTAVQNFDRYYSAINPLHHVADPDAFLRGWRPAILTDEQHLPKDEFIRTEYYNDFMLPNEAHSTMMIRLGRNGSAPQVLNINRSIGQGSFDAAALELAARYHSHFIRALSLSCKLAMRLPLDEDLTQLSGGSTNALFVTDGAGRILQTNSSAEALLRGGGGLSSTGGQLTSDNPVSRRHLASLIANAAAEADRRTGGMMAVSRCEGGPRLTIDVAPLRPPGAEFFQRQSAVLVCVVNPDQKIAPSVRRLRALFKLTPMEAKVALALLEGGDLPAAAKILGITTNTARNHLARIYEKTGVNRQIAPATLLLGCVAP